MPPVRRGFVLIAVLWVLTALASLSLLLSVTGRDTLAAQRNRVTLERARWAAEGCIAAARGVLTEALGSSDRADAAWAAADSTLASSPLLPSLACRLSVRALGTTVDVNTAGAEQLSRLLIARGVPTAQVDSLVDALLDWRDRDDQPRSLGAEQSWYVAEHRVTPRNAPLADVRELQYVRGFSALVGLDSLLGVDSTRIALGRAPAAVLASLPGITISAADRIVQLRERGALGAELRSVAGALSPDDRDSLALHYADVAPLVTAAPDGWIVRADAPIDESPAIATVEVLLVRQGKLVAVARHRSWP